MCEKLLIGCDIGTSGTKAVITDTQGNVLSESRRDYGIFTPQSGWAEQWPSIWLDAAVETIREVASKVDASRVAGVCISALYGGTGVLCGPDMKPLRPVIIWMDRRTEAEKIWVEENIGAQKIFEVSKNGTDTYFGYTKLLWVKRNEPDLWRKVRMILPVHSYIVYEMTGEITTDYSAAGNLGGFYNYAAHGWDEEIASALGIRMNMLPRRFGTPSDTAGNLNRIYARKTGLPEGIPICFGTVDCIASMLSAGMVCEGDNAAILGTSLNWGFISRQMPADSNLISMPYCVNPTEINYIYGGASAAGALPRWFLNNVLDGETAADYHSIETAIVEKGIPAGSDGLMVLPYFMGERTPIWDENASGLFLGLSLRHDKTHMFRAILESTAYSLRHIMDTMTGSESIDKIVLVGGGAKSELWQTIFADVAGKPVYTTRKPVEAPLGDAFMAGINTSLVNSYDEINRWVEFSPPVLPNKARHNAYNGYYQVYKGLYGKLKDDMKALKRLAVQT